MIKTLRAAGMSLALALAAQAAAAAEVTAILSNDNNEKGLKGQTFEHLITELKSRLGDRIDVEMHHSGTLFDQQSQVQGVQLGAASLIAPTAGVYSSIAPEVAALELPFMLDTPAKVMAAASDPVVRDAIFPKLAEKNIEIVAVWMNGPRDLGYKGDKPVLLPTDVAGMKVRVQSAPIYVEPWEAVGANPVGINWSEAPTALQQGVIDAAEVTPNSWRGSSTYQFIDQLTLTDHQYSFYLVGANKQWWDGMPEDLRDEFKAALQAATDWNVAEAVKINQGDLEFMASEGTKLNKLSPEDRAVWVEAMKPVWKDLGTDLVGDAVMVRLQEISASE
ncbi:TRAP transporter substrate-binding protein [Phaeovulum sp. W22_SRMD_FR3]